MAKVTFISESLKTLYEVAKQHGAKVRGERAADGITLSFSIKTIEGSSEEELLHTKIQELKLGAMCSFGSKYMYIDCFDSNSFDVTQTFEEWLESYDILADGCEEYLRARYGQMRHTNHDWEAIMDYECERHPEWADEDNL